MQTAKRAFSLFELLLAIAISGVLLTGVAHVTFNMLEAWSGQIEDPFFDRHVDGLRRALEECIAETNDSASGATASAAAIAGAGNAASGAEANTGRTTTATATATVRAASAIFSTPPTSVGVSRAPYLRITGAPGFLLADEQPVGYVHGWLNLEEGTGLVLYWQTDSERTASNEDTHRLVLSPWATEARYMAYSESAEEWVDVDPAAPEDIESGAAVFMSLSFSHQGQKREILLPLSDSAPHNLSY
jgi:prepilin-type N-terminal cleavage/methylation domain-containing protein